MNQLIIDRGNWRTGSEGTYRTGIGDTHLLNWDGYMCCLGFYCLQAGIPSEKLLGAGDPIDIDGVTDFYNKLEDMKLLLENREHYDDLLNKTEFTVKAIKINDKEEIAPDEREKMIKDHFGSVGIEVVFEGKYSEE